MKILVVCQYFSPEQVRLNDICFSLRQKGHEVTVLTGLPNYPTGKIPIEYRRFHRRKEIINGVHVRRLPLIPRKKGVLGLFFNYLSFAAVSSIYALFCKTDFDVSYVYQLSPVTMALPAVIISKRAHIPVFLYCLDLWPESLSAKHIGKGNPVYRILYRISRWIYQNVDRIAVSSESFERYFHEDLRLPHVSTEYLPQYAESLFQPDFTDKAPHGWDKRSGLTLTFAGNIGEMQSVETIVRAAALTRDLPSLRWVIVGEGSARVRCEKLAKELNAKTIRFLGMRRLNEMPKIYRNSDVLLVTLSRNPVISYTLPGKVQSYMAAGKAILGAADGETQKVIREAKCGVCCPAEDARGLALAAHALYSHPEQIFQYEKKSYEYYQKHFRKETFIAKTEEILNSLGNMDAEHQPSHDSQETVRIGRQIFF